jgi:adenylate cyclase
MARLSLQIGGERQTYALTQQGLTLGRALDNTIVLNHATVSRHHARIELRGREAWVIDLDSRNGVFVNRMRVEEERLEDGAMLRVGPFDLRYEERAAQSVVLDDNRYYPIAAESREVKSGELPDLSGDFQEFYHITKRLGAILTISELLEVIMEEVLRVVPAQRGVLLLRKGEELVPMVIHPAAQGELALSSTIARRALEAHEAVLTRDARMDFAGSESIISANIRSAICVPLLSDGRAIGMIYVDSAGRDKFTERQRDLLAVVASQAAISLERARLTEELRQQEQLRQNLERFLSPNVARLVASYYSRHGQLWEPQELPVSVLFADVKGFTSLSERLSPRETQDLLNEYLHEMTEVIFKYHGTLDKYIGDGIMAVFGAPRLSGEGETRQHAIQAVDAALGMIEAHRGLMEKIDADRAFSFRIGINTGPVYAGFFGTRHRLEYTVIGDTVNTAARLESSAAPNQMLIGEATWQAVRDVFLAEEVGELQLKGKAQRVRAYRVLGRAAVR